MQFKYVVYSLLSSRDGEVQLQNCLSLTEY